MLGITIGVSALIIILSVMNGFQKEVRDRMLSVLSHVEIFEIHGTLTDWENTAAEAAKHPQVIGTAPYVSGQVMLARNDILRGTLIRGIDPALEPKVSEIAGQLVGGRLTDLQPGEFNIILGRELALSLDLRLGDRVAVIAPQGTITPAGVLPRMRQFTVTGMFESGHFEYDSSLAFVHLEDAAKLFRVNGVTGLRLKIARMNEAPKVAEELRAHIRGNVFVRDWSSQNRSWFAAVQTEKRMMFIILTLIMAVAAFNLVSTLVMTVTDKQSDIAILRTLGATPRSIAWIFMVQGALIGLIGTTLGVSLGSLVAFHIDVIVPVIERGLGVQFIPKDIYFISALPSDPRLSDIAMIGGVSLLLSLLATLYPSYNASRVKPAEALRYE